MNPFRISKQTEAEKDEFLYECFHDTGCIESLIDKNLSIISGRKGAGKTALAKYLEKKSKDYNIDFAFRISIRNISVTENDEKLDRIHSIVFYLIIQSIQKLLDEDLLDSGSKEYWHNFLIQNGVQGISDYEAFVESQKKNSRGFNFMTMFSAGFSKVSGGANTNAESQLSRTTISNSPSSLINSLVQSLPKDKIIFIFIDDISDHLDNADSKKLKADIALIQQLLLDLETYNSIFSDAEKKFRFVSLLREDLFDFMEGSNVNKLRSDSLNLEWNEKSFAGLLIRRLPFFQDNLKESLLNPVDAIHKQFPDVIFSSTLENFSTNHYQTNFYAYMVAISFNRPRDFLMFCYAMRDRLSERHPATIDNIESAEVEYADYFINELRDELFLASKLLNCDLNNDRLNQLIDILSQKEGFKFPQLRSDIGKYLGETGGVGKMKVELFIQELWRYGILGFHEGQNGIIGFNYIKNHKLFLVWKIKEYIYFLHRGLWWFTQKRKKN